MSIRRDLINAFEDGLKVSNGRTISSALIIEAYRHYYANGYKGVQGSGFWYSAKTIQEEIKRNGVKGRILFLRPWNGGPKLCTIFTPVKDDYGEIVVCPNPAIGQDTPSQVVNSKDDLVKIITKLINNRLRALEPEVTSLKIALGEYVDARVQEHR